jgi:hypothetical protein
MPLTTIETRPTPSVEQARVGYRIDVRREVGDQSGRRSVMPPVGYAEVSAPMAAQGGYPHSLTVKT